MDLTNRSRHSHRTIARHRTTTVSDAEYSSFHFLQLLREADRSGTASAVSPRPIETGGAGAFETARPLLNIYDPALEALPASWQPLAMLAEKITEQADYAGACSDEMKQALHQPFQKVFVAGNPGETAGRAPSRSPTELLSLLKAVVGSSTTVKETPPPTLFAPAIRTSPPALRRTRRRGPKVETLPDGQRIERFESGAHLVKDEVGRVVEVVSCVGESISYSYDSAGNLDSFVRADSRNRLHSAGRRDKHGVVVRDQDGRVRAAGESMSVDPLGLLCIHNHDGQFVSLDLLRGLHLERKRVTTDDDAWQTVTAVFAHDGFRLATRLHLSPFDSDFREIVGAGSERLRFYGRDGSLIDFDSEEDMRGYRPARVLSPGSVHVDSAWRGKRQAGTAWEAVQEYLALIS